MKKNIWIVLLFVMVSWVCFAGDPLWLKDGVKGNLTGNVVGNVTGNVVGNLTGTASLAGSLTTSITSTGTITTGVWNGTAVAIGYGGTGQTTKAAAFDALSPMSAQDDLIIGGASGTGTRLVKGSNADVLTMNGSGHIAWAAPAGGAANAVISSASGERIERATVNGDYNGSVRCTSTPCTITRQSGAFSSVSRASNGAYVLNFTAGKFSAAPTCVCIALDTDQAACMPNPHSGNNTSTAVYIQTIDIGTVANVDSGFEVICMGPT